MATTMSQLDGPKRGPHTTHSAFYSSFLRKIVSAPCIRKISLGYLITGINAKRRYIKIREEVGCILLILVDTTSRQEVCLYGNGKEVRELALEKASQVKQVEIFI